MESTGSRMKSTNGVSRSAELINWPEKGKEGKRKEKGKERKKERKKERNLYPIGAFHPQYAYHLMCPY